MKTLAKHLDTVAHCKIESSAKLRTDNAFVQLFIHQLAEIKEFKDKRARRRGPAPKGSGGKVKAAEAAYQIKAPVMP